MKVAILTYGEFGTGADFVDAVEEVEGVEGLFFGHCGEVEVVVTSTASTAALRSLRNLGVETFIVGGVGRRVGGGVGVGPSERDLLILDDHLNLTGWNPLVGENADGFGPRFPDMSEAYDPYLRALALQAAEGLKIPHRVGVFAEVSRERWTGLRDHEDSIPEDEIALIARAGAEMVGVGIVPEVIVARHMGVRVLGVARDHRDGSSGASIAPLIREIVKELSST